MNIDPIYELQAIEKIKQLKARYFRFMDTKDWQALRSVFCREAVFDATRALEKGRIVNADANGSADWHASGRDAIVEFISSTSGTTSTVHHGHGHEISLVSDHAAKGIIAMQDHNRYYDTDGNIRGEMLGYGHYEEEYRIEDGEWRIFRSKLTRLRVDLEMTAPK